MKTDTTKFYSLYQMKISFHKKWIKLILIK